MGHRDPFQVPAKRRKRAREELSGPLDTAPDSNAPLPVAVRGPLAEGINVWCAGWLVKNLPGSTSEAEAYKNHSGALLEHRWFDRAVWRAVLDLLIDEKETTC